MKLKISNEKYNKVLERKDVDIVIEHSTAPTPTKASIRETVAKHYGAKAENVEIMSVFSMDGKNSSSTKARVWDKKVVEERKKPVEAPAA